MSTDPSEQYFSPYIYSGNNPLTTFDPDGRLGVSIGGVYSFQAFGGMGQTAIGLTIDDDFNLGLEITMTKSPNDKNWGAGVSGGAYFKLYSMDNIYDQRGTGGSLGGYGGYGPGVGLEYNNYIVERKDKPGCWERVGSGITLSGGLGFTIGVGIYGAQDKTFVVGINLKQAALIGRHLLNKQSFFIVSDDGHLLIITSSGIIDTGIIIKKEEDSDKDEDEKKASNIGPKDNR